MDDHVGAGQDRRDTGKQETLNSPPPLGPENKTGGKQYE